jgi:hypothetical protein
MKTSHLSRNCLPLAAENKINIQTGSCFYSKSWLCTIFAVTKFRVARIYNSR